MKTAKKTRDRTRGSGSLAAVNWCAPRISARAGKPESLTAFLRDLNWQFFPNYLVTGYIPLYLVKYKELVFIIKSSFQKNYTQYIKKKNHWLCFLRLFFFELAGGWVSCVSSFTPDTGCLKTISLSLSSSFILATSDFRFSKNVGVQTGVGPWVQVKDYNT